MKHRFLCAMAFICLTWGLSVSQQLPEKGYIDWGYKKPGAGFASDFINAYNAWEKGKALYDSEDDHFFISRVKPKLRFRFAGSQIQTDLTEENDKRIMFWVPINTPQNNALPDGVFDSEVFSMWPYIHHYGNWTAPFVRMPGNFADVAHKNGVGTSVLAGIPYGQITQGWLNILNKITESGSGQKMADLLAYYGIDGLGYNSEFSYGAGGGAFMNKIIDFHKKLYKLTRGNGKMPLYELVWYDLTNDNAGISFDQGLDTHNDGIFGTGADPVTTAMFFNYNWNRPLFINKTKQNVAKLNRNLLDIYAGINMQGGEPGGTVWPLLKQHNYSIGLWGAHAMNMFFETRGEQGAHPDTKQRIYQMRLERWFNGGNRNPAKRPAISSLLSYNAYNYKFMGMAEFVTAKSSLSWDLSQEPFITYFNLGNGKFFNLEGKQSVAREWYNIGMQDYLPTWRWWFADKFLGRQAADVPENGLDAEFVWDDAWFGGSLMRVWGSHSDEYLHLFKTRFALAAGDKITLRYKVKGGKADIDLAFSSEDAVGTPQEVSVAQKTALRKGEWIEKSFTVGENLSALSGKNLAVVALRFRNAENLNLYLGEFSIVRGTFETPAAPMNIRSKVFNSNRLGVDGKIIFDMPNNKPAGEVCYNLDVKTAFFKLYAQQKNADPICMGATTSWAGMFYAVPFNFDGEAEIRFGVSAVGLDMKSESAITWGDWHSTAGKYQINDDIILDKSTIKPKEAFRLSFVDPKHEPAKFELIDAATGTVVKTADNVLELALPGGLDKLGVYDLRVTGNVQQNDGSRPVQVRTFGAYVQITPVGVGALPQIESLTANDKTSDVEVKVGEAVLMKYTGRDADGASSRGVDLKEQGFGFKASEVGLNSNKSFSLAFWLKVNQFNGATNLLNIRDKQEGWPKTDWGWIWNFLDKDGNFESITFRGTDASSNLEFQIDFSNVRLQAGPWTHLAYVFEFDDQGKGRVHLYLNGVKQMPKRWRRASEGNGMWTNGEPPLQDRLYNMRPQNVVAIGGSHFSSGGVDGSIDNFQYWDKALSEEEVKASMADLSAPYPANLKAFWSIEDNPGDDHLFVSSVGRAQAGVHNYQKTGGEGQGKLQWIAPQYKPGCPFISGTAYPVKTLARWDTERGEFSDILGNAVAGEASVTFESEGRHQVTLILENGWGRDTKTFDYITVKGFKNALPENQLEAAISSFPNPFVDELNIRFADAGAYSLEVSDLNGRVVYRNEVRVGSGDFASLRLNTPQGLYILHIKQEGKLLQTLKLIKQ